MITPRRSPSIVESFNYAIEGIIHVLRTQRNMRIHFAVAVVVLIAALVSDVSRLELIALFIAIRTNAIAVGYLVFSGQVADESSRLLDRLSEAPAELTLVALVITIVLVIAMKALGGRGSPLRGGWPSGHAAIAFAAWMAVTLVIGDSSHRFLVSSLTLIMALLVAQTRIEAGVHTTLEVASGGALGALVTLAVFQGFSG